LTIDGVVMAGSQNSTSGTFWYENYNSGLQNVINLLGGVIQNARGPVGTFDQSTNTLLTGYSKNYVYDPRLGSAPPPFFPITGAYDVLSWQSQGA
jgi:hypothetical protein